MLTWVINKHLCPSLYQFHFCQCLLLVAVVAAYDTALSVDVKEGIHGLSYDAAKLRGCLDGLLIDHLVVLYGIEDGAGGNDGDL